MKKPSVILALILLPAFFLLHNYNELFKFISVKDVLFYAFLIYTLLAVAFIFLVRLKISAAKASLILFVITFFILFFTPVHDAYRVITFNSVLSHYWVLLPLLCLALLLLARKIIRTDNIPSKIFTLITFVTVGLFLTEVVTSFLKESQYKTTKNLIYPQKPLFDEYKSPHVADSSKPDIYFFVFDEYTNNSALKKIWGFDNSKITDWLTTNGFHIPPNTHTNYSFTVFSISSTFNMDYIDKKVGSDGTVTTSIMKANQSLSDNETMAILRKENYAIHFIAPFKNTIQENGLGHFFDYLVDGQIPRQTLPGSIGATITSDLRSNKLYYTKDSLDYVEEVQQKVAAIHSTIEQIKKTTDSNANRKPNFVYGHVLVPHVPHIFDSTRGFLTYAQSSKLSLFETYTSQVRYANKIIEELVSYIKANNKRNTIIIIEGDHGYRRFPDSLSMYALPNFSAIYFPDQDYTRLYDSLSPVNTFRIIFDQYFHQSFPLLKDSSTIVKDNIY